MRRMVLVKKKRDEPQRVVTKRQLARWQQQRRLQRIIFGTGILVIVAVLGVMGVGWYLGWYQPLRETVIRVNDTEFNMDYYVKALEFHLQGQSGQMVQFLINSVAQSIQQNELIRQETLKLGITIDDETVDQELESRAFPVNQVTRDIVRTDLLINKLQDEYLEQQVPVFAEQKHIWAMFLENESQANEVRNRLEGGEDFAELAGELSLDNLTKTEQGDLGWRPKGVLTALMGTSIPDEYIFTAEAGALSPPLHDEAKRKSVGYWLIKVLEISRKTKEADIQAILLATKEQAEEVRARLEAGEDFAKLANELSQHDEWDVGWVNQGEMSSGVAEYVFNPEMETRAVSKPIRDDTVVTEGGYWLLKVVDVDDNRQIGEDDRDLLKARALNEWLTELLSDPENTVESYLDPKKIQWVISRFTKG
jgi:parvulin-like peptidyl-prolyl isomerase